MMTIYVLKHPQPDFKGIIFGVDFHAGVGTTSNLSQVADFLDLGQGYKVAGVNGPLTGEEKAEVLSFRKRRQPIKHAMKAVVKPLPKKGDWIAL